MWYKSQSALLRAALLSALAIFVAVVCGSPSDGQKEASSSSVTFPDLYEASIEELQVGLEKGHFTSVDLVKVSASLEIFSVVVHALLLDRRTSLASTRSTFKGPFCGL